MYNPNVNRLNELDENQRYYFNIWVQEYFQRLETNMGYQPCAKWYLHPEAVDRLLGLWAAYLNVSLPMVDDTGELTDPENDRQNAASLRDWWREADWHNQKLFEGQSSPFSGCTVLHHVEPHVYQKNNVDELTLPEINWAEVEEGPGAGEKNPELEVAEV